MSKKKIHIDQEFKPVNSVPFKPMGIGNEKIILNFKHIPNGKNCQTSALRKLLYHYNLDISEEMLVGIGSGLGFIYWFMKMMPTPFSGAMNSGKFPGLIGRITQRLGGTYHVLKTASVKAAHKQLIDCLKQGQPAFVCVDMAFIDYMGMKEDQHFGQHTFLVYGIDEPNNIVHIADRFNVVCTLPLTCLQQARASLHPPFPALNQMLQFNFPKQLPDLKPLIELGVKENVNFMTNPPIQNFGLPGILKWSKELIKYPQMIPDPLNLIGALWSHFIYIETGGSGGSFFRNIYSQFLKEAHEITNNVKYLNAASSFLEIAEVWKSIAISFLPDEFEELKEIRQILYKNNEEMEQKGNDALSGLLVRQKRMDELIKSASKYIKNKFDKIILPTKDLLIEVHQMEAEAFKILS